jgi:hypothetical protein
MLLLFLRNTKAEISAPDKPLLHAPAIIILRLSEKLVGQLFAPVQGEAEMAVPGGQGRKLVVTAVSKGIQPLQHGVFLKPGDIAFCKDTKKIRSSAVSCILVIAGQIDTGIAEKNMTAVAFQPGFFHVKYLGVKPVKSNENAGQEKDYAIIWECLFVLWSDIRFCGFPPHPFLFVCFCCCKIKE